MLRAVLAGAAALLAALPLACGSSDPAGASPQAALARAADAPAEHESATMDDDSLVRRTTYEQPLADEDGTMP